MKKENKRLSKQEAILLFCVASVTIILANILFLNYTNIIHIDFDIGDAIIIELILWCFIIIFSAFPAHSSIDDKETKCNNNSTNFRKKLGYSDDYSFMKSEIDKLHFDTPSQMADYFCKNFNDYPSFECTLRMTVFAYNYFKIEKLAERDSSFNFVVKWFNSGFNHANELKRLIDVPTILNVEKYISSYDDIKFVVYNLFEDSELKNKYRDIFDKKHMLNKYKL